MLSSRTLLTMGLICCPPALAVAAPRLVKVGSAGSSGQITFTNVGQPNGARSFVVPGNPIIKGNNLYAPDLRRVGDRWYCYHGGWLTTGQVNDRIYLGISASLEPVGPWQPASQLVIDNGEYQHVHDPSVAVHDGTWYMVYTAFKTVGTHNRDWINYSTSTDGLTWTPSQGTASTEITILDPNNIAGGPITDMARPALVRAGGTWKMWFDARVNTGSTDSYLAHGTGAAPNSFALVHKYPRIEGFPGFFEPSVALRPNGQYVAVVQRHFRDLYLAYSSNGVNFTFKKDLSSTYPLFGRERVSNPGLIYDQTTDRLLGLGFGMTDSTALVDHDIGFSVLQYAVQVRSPGNVWHVFAEADRLGDQSVWVFGYTEFDSVRLIDPVSGTTLLQQDFSTAQVGDVWHVQWTAGAPIIAPHEPNPDTTVTYREYIRQLALVEGDTPVQWSLVAGPQGASVDGTGRVSGWTPSRPELGQLVGFEVSATNAAGSHSTSWEVQVLQGPPDFDGDGDVDQDDFGHFQRCLSGQYVPQTAPECGPALLDDDDDVDGDDFVIFLGCYSGPNVPAAIDCAQ